MQTCLRISLGLKSVNSIYNLATPALVPGNKNMSERQLSGSIALTKLTHVLKEMPGKGKKPVLCLVIPIESNALEVKDNAVYMGVRVTTRDEADKYDQHGFISKTVKRDKKWAEMTDAEKEAEKLLTPILGNIKDFSAGGSANDTSGAASSDVLGEDDDLPF